MKRIFTLTFLLFSTAITFAQNALNFDGVNDYVQAPNPGPIDSASRTVEAWVNFTNATLAKPQFVVVDWGDMANGHRFTLNIRLGIPRIEIGGFGISSPNVLTANVWHHIATTYAKGGNPKVRLYVDGNEVANGNFTLPMVTSSVNGIIIGRRNDGINNFGGLIDEVRIWDTDRSAAEILNNMNNEFCSPQPNLVAYYNFNQGVAGSNNSAITSLIDNSGSANNGVITNFGLLNSSSNFVVGKSLTTLNNNIIQTSGTLTTDALIGNYQWLDCSANYSAILGETSSSFTPSTMGNYSVVVTENWCIDTSSCINITTVSTNDINSASSEISIYPNPISENSLIHISNIKLSNYNLKITDIKGREIIQMKNNSESAINIDLSNYASGIYVLEFSNSKEVFHKKLMK